MQRPNRLAIPQRPSFVLKFISYGHANGPLEVKAINEKARLSYSVRDVPNPPVQLKKKYSTGLSTKMREEILSNKGVQGRLDQILEAIEDKMTELEEERSREPSPEPEAVLKGQEPPREVIVAIMSEEGMHRSVAFVDEISKNPNLKRKNWEIKVEHRDVDDELMDEEDEDEEEEEVTSPGHPKAKKQIDKRRKQMRSLSMRLEDE